MGKGDDARMIANALAGAGVDETPIPNGVTLPTKKHISIVVAFRLLPWIVIALLVASFTAIGLYDVALLTAMVGGIPLIQMAVIGLAGSVARLARYKGFSALFTLEGINDLVIGMFYGILGGKMAGGFGVNNDLQQAVAFIAGYKGHSTMDVIERALTKRLDEGPNL